MHNMDEFQNNYAEVKSQTWKREPTAWFYLYKILENASLSVETESRSVVSYRQKGRNYKRHKNTFEVMDMFIIMTVVSFIV